MQFYSSKARTYQQSFRNGSCTCDANRTPLQKSSIWKKTKIDFFEQRFFLVIGMGLENVCFKGESLRPSSFLYLVVTIRYCDSYWKQSVEAEIELAKRPKLIFSRKEKFWSLEWVWRTRVSKEKVWDLLVFSISVSLSVTVIWTRFSDRETRNSIQLVRINELATVYK